MRGIVPKKSIWPFVAFVIVEPSTSSIRWCSVGVLKMIGNSIGGSPPFSMAINSLGILLEIEIMVRL